MKLALDALLRQAQGLPITEFQRLYPHAALVFVVARDKPLLATFDTRSGLPLTKGPSERRGDSTPFVPMRTDLERATREALEETEQGGDSPSRIAECFDGVEFLVKSGRNPFSEAIIVGRAPNSDISIPDSTVSKVHAYIRQTPSGWAITDHNSTNGTYMNGQRLKQVATPLHDGAVVDLGTNIRVRFFTSEGLFRFLELYGTGALGSRK
jgi:hypothetical protein